MSICGDAGGEGSAHQHLFSRCQSHAGAGAGRWSFYVCTPNNPTGTMTSHSDIEYLVERKPAGSVVMVDEAYLHFSDGVSAIDLVKANKDVIVLRTFSKIYGMAGLRCGLVIAHPELQTKIAGQGGWSAMPTTAVMAASASLQDAQLVPERKRINAEIREQSCQWARKQGVCLHALASESLHGGHEASGEGCD